VCPDRVLLVDDDTMGVDLLKMILESEGYIVETSESGESAIHKLKESSFNLVIIDYNLPDIKGDELAMKMRSHNPGLRLILLTGLKSAMDSSQFKGFESILEKPIDPMKLIGTLRGDSR
jgi:CheY-like chemotaxis protein